MKRELRKQGKYLQMDPNNFELKVVFHRLKKEYNKTLKMTKRNFYKQIILQLDTLHENDPKSFWRTVDQLKNKSSDNSNPINISTWYNYLSNLYEEKNPDLDLTDLELNTAGPLNYPFTCKEVRSGIEKLKNNKQPGLDLILMNLSNMAKTYFYFQLLNCSIES